MIKITYEQYEMRQYEREMERLHIGRDTKELESIRERLIQSMTTIGSKLLYSKNENKELHKLQNEMLTEAHVIHKILDIRKRNKIKEIKDKRPRKFI